MHEIADFRSDKVTRPTPEMVRAMSRCEWGDGQEDQGPTVRELESLASGLTGKPAALFVISGTLANELAIRAHTCPGDQVILDESSHIACVEHGTPATFSGVQTRTVPAENGLPTLDRIREALQSPFLHTSLICVENTHNFLGGCVPDLERMRELHALASSHGALVHLDGARIFNASVKTGIAVSEYARCADSLMFCLSKGLCAPAGSMLCGKTEFIERVRRLRLTLGAFPKQSAPLAACGLVGLKTMVGRLTEDHEHAALLAQGLRSLPAASRRLDVEAPHTNMVFFRLKGIDPARFIKDCDRQGIRGYHLGGGRIRFVTHRDIDGQDVTRTVTVIRELLT